MSINGLTRCTWLAFPHRFTPIASSAPSCNLLHTECAIDTSHRYQRYYTENALLDTWSITYDFATATPVNFFYVARADLLQDLTNIILEGSNDNIAFTPVRTYTAPLTLTGVRDNDLFDCFDDTAAFRYWRITINLGTQQRICFSKIIFGQMIDMGREPEVTTTENREATNSASFRTTSARICLSQTEHSTYQYRVSYRNVKTAVIERVIDNLLVRDKRFSLLVNIEDNALFNGHDVIHGIISNVIFEQITDDVWTLDYEFNEMVG